MNRVLFGHLWRSQRTKLLVVCVAMTAWNTFLPVIYKSFGQQMKILVDSGVIPRQLTNFGGVGIGANMAFRRAAFSEGGVFNERLDRGTPLFGFGEHYAFFSLVHRGHRVIYAPEATALHPYPASMELLRDRHLNDLTSSAGYLLFLLLEHPHYRIATLRFIARGLRKGPLDWKRIHRPPRPRLVPRWQASMALVKGLLRYLQSLAVPSRKSGRPAPFPAQSSTECLLVPPKQ